MATATNTANQIRRHDAETDAKANGNLNLTLPPAIILSCLGGVKGSPERSSGGLEARKAGFYQTPAGTGIRTLGFGLEPAAPTRFPRWIRTLRRGARYVGTCAAGSGPQSWGPLSKSSRWHLRKPSRWHHFWSKSSSYSGRNRPRKLRGQLRAIRTQARRTPSVAMSQLSSPPARTQVKVDTLLQSAAIRRAAAVGRVFICGRSHQLCSMHWVRTPSCSGATTSRNT